MRAALAGLPAIRPITDLRTNLNEVCAQATETQEPVVLTKNGSASYVLMDSDAYDAAAQRNRIYLALKEAEIEEKYHPEAIPGDEVRIRMEKLFATMGVEYA